MGSNLEINFCDDIRIKWDWMRYKIRQESISFSKLKAKERRKRLCTIENDLKVSEKELAEVTKHRKIVLILKRLRLPI